MSNRLNDVTARGDAGGRCDPSVFVNQKCAVGANCQCAGDGCVVGNIEGTVDADVGVELQHAFFDLACQHLPQFILRRSY